MNSSQSGPGTAAICGDPLKIEISGAGAGMGSLTDSVIFVCLFDINLLTMI